VCVGQLHEVHTALACLCCKRGSVCVLLLYVLCITRCWLIVDVCLLMFMFMVMLMFIFGMLCDESDFFMHFKACWINNCISSTGGYLKSRCRHPE